MTNSFSPIPDNNHFAALIDGRSGRRSALLQEDVFIGRSRQNDIVLSGDLTVSRKQARVFRVGQNYYIEDLASTNGTLLNGRQLKGQAQLAQDDVINIGRSTFLFSTARNAFDDEDEPTTVVVAGGLSELVNRMVSGLKAAFARLKPVEQRSLSRAGSRYPEENFDPLSFSRDAFDFSECETVEPASDGNQGKILSQALKQYQKRRYSITPRSPQPSAQMKG